MGSSRESQVAFDGIGSTQGGLLPPPPFVTVADGRLVGDEKYVANPSRDTWPDRGGMTKSLLVTEISPFKTLFKGFCGPTWKTLGMTTVSDPQCWWRSSSDWRPVNRSFDRRWNQVGFDRGRKVKTDGSAALASSAFVNPKR